MQKKANKQKRPIFKGHLRTHTAYTAKNLKYTLFSKENRSTILNFPVFPFEQTADKMQGSHATKNLQYNFTGSTKMLDSSIRMLCKHD